MIFFDGKSSDDVRAVVERYPARVFPQRKVETVSVPGRNGDLLFAQDAWENYIAAYDIYISAESTRLPFAAHQIAKWLFGAKGYARLQDDYDAGFFRMAFFSGPLEIENILNRYGRATIEFNCKPQSFLLEGEQALHFESGGVMINPTGFPAHPLIVVHGSGAGSIQIGAYPVTITQIADGMVLDADTQNAYLGTSNLNGNISAAIFPILEAGESAVSFSGGVTGIEIMPRWWTL